MNLTVSPAPKSVVSIGIEVPPDRLTNAVSASAQKLARRTRVPGFRPGKAPRVMIERVLGDGAVLDDAVDGLVDSTYRDAILELKLVPLARPNVEIVQAEEGKPLIFTAVVPILPEVHLGDYRNFPFAPEIQPVDDTRVEQVIDQLREQEAILQPVEDRPAANGDYMVIAFHGSVDDAAFEGGDSDRTALRLGAGRLLPGFEDHLVGLRKGDTIEFDLALPESIGDPRAAGKTAHFKVEVNELTVKILPEPDDDFAHGQGPFGSLDEMREDIRARLGRSSLDQARHRFADRILEYAVANATVDLPDILVEEELDLLMDEFWAALGRQGVSQESYLNVLNKSVEELRSEYRGQAERRAKTLLVLGRLADIEGITIPPAEIDAEVARARSRYTRDSGLVRYFESERGRAAIRSTLRRSRVIDKIIDEWLANHSDQPALPHLEESAEGRAAEPTETPGRPVAVETSAG